MDAMHRIVVRLTRDYSNDIAGEKQDQIIPFLQFKGSENFSHNLSLRRYCKNAKMVRLWDLSAFGTVLTAVRRKSGKPVEMCGSSNPVPLDSAKGL